MFQIGFLEILIILILGLIIIVPKKLPEAIKIGIMFYKKVDKQLRPFIVAIAADIRADELKKDVFNELRMEELENKEDSKND